MLANEATIIRDRDGAARSAMPRKQYFDGRKPLVRLVEELSRKRLGHVYIRKGEFSLTVGRTR